MTGDTNRVSIRLAELVAALSLGVDLGFGQPLEPAALRSAAGSALTGATVAGSASRPAVLLSRVIGAWGLVPPGWALWLTIRAPAAANSNRRQADSLATQMDGYGSLNPVRGL